MPSRNVVREDADEQYYHVFNRSTASEVVFRDEKDYIVFLSLLKRYLQKEPARDADRHLFENYYNSIELLAYCIMPTHYHLLIYQKEQGDISEFMRKIISCYTYYFNKKYHRRGALFTGRFRASRIDHTDYLTHVSRYIHLNSGKGFETYKWSSYENYCGNKKADWLRPQKVLGIFKDKKDYIEFVSDYEDMHDELDTLKWTLADDGKTA